MGEKKGRPGLSAEISKKQKESPRGVNLGGYGKAEAEWYAGSVVARQALRDVVHQVAQQRDLAFQPPQGLPDHSDTGVTRVRAANHQVSRLLAPGVGVLIRQRRGRGWRFGRRSAEIPHHQPRHGTCQRL